MLATALTYSWVDPVSLSERHEPQGVLLRSMAGRANLPRFQSRPEHIVALARYRLSPSQEQMGEGDPVTAPRQPAAGLPLVQGRLCKCLIPGGRIAAYYARGARALWMSCCASRPLAKARVSLLTSAQDAAM